MSSPYENPALWDYVVIGDITLPPAGVAGKVKVKVKSKIKSDTKSPSGKTGGRTTTQGLDLADVDIEMEWPDAEGQYDLVRAAMDKIWPPKKEAEGVAHGNTDAAGVRDIQIREVEWTDWADGKGHLKIGAREFRPDPPKGTTGGGSGIASGSLADLKAKLAAAQSKLAAAKAKNIQDATEIAVLNSEIASLQALIALYGSATNTPTSTNPTKQCSKGSGGVPLGEIQPADRVPTGEVQP